MTDTPTHAIHMQPSTSDSAGQSPTLCALQIHLLTYLLTYLLKIHYETAHLQHAVILQLINLSNLIN